MKISKYLEHRGYQAMFIRESERSISGTTEQSGKESLVCVHTTNTTRCTIQYIPKMSSLKHVGSFVW